MPSTVFAAPPTTRQGLNSSQGVRAPHTVEGACETKQTSFEWPIRNVRDLKAQLDEEAERGLMGSDSPDDEDRHEVLAGDGAFFDDLAYKLHLGGYCFCFFKELLTGLRAGARCCPRRR